MLRKKLFKSEPIAPLARQDSIDISAVATVLVTSERAAQPVDNIFDGQRGPAASRWVAEQPGEQTLILAFDIPQDLNFVAIEIEETEVARRQEILLSVSQDGGLTYRDLIRQEYDFSPTGATFESEHWTIREKGVTHLRLMIKPDKGDGPGHATVSALSVG